MMKFLISDEGISKVQQFEVHIPVETRLIWLMCDNDFH